MKRSKDLKKLLIGIGMLLIAVAIGLSVYNVYDSHRAEQKAARIAQAFSAVVRPAEETEVLPEYISHPDMEMPTIEIEGERYVGTLIIPDLELELPVAAGEFSMKKLKKTPAVYAGSVYQNNMVIAAHNYRSHFGRLPWLDIGAPILFKDAAGNTFRYTVGWSEKVQPSDPDRMTEPADWDLTLFTCTYDNKQRFTLRLIAEEK